MEQHSRAYKLLIVLKAALKTEQAHRSHVANRKKDSQRLRYFPRLNVIFLRNSRDSEKLLNMDS